MSVASISFYRAIAPRNDSPSASRPVPKAILHMMDANHHKLHGCLLPGSRVHYEDIAGFEL
jgi:hypothetical protein